ncbi:MAG: preprotein translocase subunit YajC [Candidatus Omnitrophica bacterium]|jgi:preprotein translocase subunit YajC|nr:preprotein translocase subunit YajC [Candidatus Omnitrophota bacterium]
MPQAQAVNPILNLVPLVLIFVIFYFMLIRPQKAKEREHQKMLASLDKNDEVITSGGIHGTVINVKEKSVVIRIDDNVKMEVEKNCVAVVKKS